MFRKYCIRQCCLGKYYFGNTVSENTVSEILYRKFCIGYIVSEDGIEADPEKISAIENWPTPGSPEDVRRFLGFAGYYRKFVKDFAKIARPLFRLLPATATKKYKKGAPKTRPSWQWNQAEDEAFKELKSCLISSPILGYVDYSTPFELHVDASQDGLGAVLYQEQDGQLRVIAYASRSLNKSERNYPAHKLEFLCLKWAITEKFNDYLYGNTFEVVTDNNPLTYVLTSARLDATGHRWLAALACYNFKIRYRPGKANSDADALSRLPGTELQSTEQISTESVKAICNAVGTTAYVESLCFSTSVVKDSLEVTDDRCEMNARDWRRTQAKDPALTVILDHLRRGTRIDRTKYLDDEDVLALLRNIHNFKLKRGVLVRKTVVNEVDQEQLVLPRQCRPVALRSLHDNAGHPGRDRTVSLLRDRFFWPGMTKDVDQHVQHCDRCLRRKSNILASYPIGESV